MCLCAHMSASMCRMPPLTTLEVPKFMLWKRHSHTIRSISDNDLWFASLGLARLREHGAPDAPQIQMQLLSSRIVSLVRKKSVADVRDGLRALFSSSREAEDMDLTDPIVDFHGAMVVYLHFSRMSINQRIKLLKEAAAYVQEESESPLLAAVNASPRGRDVLLEGTRT